MNGGSTQWWYGNVRGWHALKPSWYRKINSISFPSISGQRRFYSPFCCSTVAISSYVAYLQPEASLWLLDCMLKQKPFEIYTAKIWRTVWAMKRKKVRVWCCDLFSSAGENNCFNSEEHPWCCQGIQRSLYWYGTLQKMPAVRQEEGWEQSCVRESALVKDLIISYGRFVLKAVKEIYPND